MQYRINRRGTQRWSRKRDLDKTIALLKRKLAGASTVALKRRGSDRWGQFRPIDEALERLRKHLANASAGAVWFLRSDADTEDWAVRCVEDAAPLQETIGNSKIDRIYSEVTARWKVESWGICNRRYIDGTTTWSQHCPWPAPDPGSNAWDIHASTFTMGRVAKALAANAEKWEVGRGIYAGRVWDRVRGWHDSPGIGHYDHIHVEGYPERTGTPRSGCP
jgi:hypothetical protein